MFLSIGTWGVAVPLSYFSLHFLTDPQSCDVSSIELRLVWWSMCSGAAMADLLLAAAILCSSWQELSEKAALFSAQQASENEAATLKELQSSGMSTGRRRREPRPTKQQAKSEGDSSSEDDYDMVAPISVPADRPRTTVQVTTLMVNQIEVVDSWEVRFHGIPGASCHDADQGQPLVPPAVAAPFSCGVFATARIPKGSLCWDVTKRCKRMIPEAIARDLLLGGSLTQGGLMEHLASNYWDHLGENMIDMRNDDGVFFSHSDSNPNVALGAVSKDENMLCSYAQRDIAVGEELLENFDSYVSREPRWYLLRAIYLPQNPSIVYCFWVYLDPYVLPGVGTRSSYRGMVVERTGRRTHPVAKPDP